MAIRFALALILIAPIWSTIPTLAAPTIAAKRPAARDLPALRAEAEALRKKGATAEATSLLWENVEKLDPAAFVQLIQLHEIRKEWDEVVRAANLLASKKPNDPKTVEALTHQGRAHFIKGRLKEAKDSLKRALELNKHYEPAYDVYALIYEKMPYEQRLLYQDMVETFGPKPAYLTKLCAINTADGENEQGEQICNQAIKADGKIADNHVNLGIIAKQKGEPEKAKTLLKAAADMFPASEQAQHEYAAFLEEEKNHVDSYKYYERCISAAAESERCLMGVGNSGLQLQKYDRALTVFRSLCRKAGRKYAAQVRKAVHALQKRKAGEWAEKFEDIAERCSYY